ARTTDDWLFSSSRLPRFSSNCLPRQDLHSLVKAAADEQLQSRHLKLRGDIMEDERCERILFLFRHGETDWNREGRLQGHTDTPLNATGVAQAERLSESLRPHRLDAVVSSDLSRALTTAQIVADALRVPLLVDPGLRETDVGAAEGLLWAEARVRFGE